MKAVIQSVAPWRILPPFLNVKLADATKAKHAIASLDESIPASKHWAIMFHLVCIVVLVPLGRQRRGCRGR